MTGVCALTTDGCVKTPYIRAAICFHCVVSVQSTTKTTTVPASESSEVSSEVKLPWPGTSTHCHSAIPEFLARSGAVKEREDVLKEVTVLGKVFTSMAFSRAVLPAPISPVNTTRVRRGPVGDTVRKRRARIIEMTTTAIAMITGVDIIETITEKGGLLELMTVRHLTPQQKLSIRVGKNERVLRETGSVSTAKEDRFTFIHVSLVCYIDHTSIPHIYLTNQMTPPPDVTCQQVAACSGRLPSSALWRLPPRSPASSLRTSPVLHPPLSPCLYWPALLLRWWVSVFPTLLWLCPLVSLRTSA